MSKVEKTMVPELRFPEFVNDGQWEEKKLGKLGRFLGGGTPDKSNTDYWKGSIPWVSSSDISGDNIHSISISRFINEKSIKQSATKLIPKQSILFVSRVGVGKLAINKEELCTSQDFTNFVSKDVHNYFIAYYFSSHKHLLQSLNQGTSIKGFSKADLENIDLFIPTSSKEQQKIASCLSSLDELIAAHSNKLEALKDYKKGLIQNLFPQEGQKIPNYRFLEFEDDGEWIERQLEDVATFSKGKGISKSDIVKDGDLPCIRYGELYTHYNETISVIKSRTNLAAKDLVLSEANDVIIPASGETQIDIATASCVLEKGIALGGDLNIIRTNINGIFLSYYLNNIKKKDIAQMAQGISVVHLYANQLKTLVFYIPKSQEQKKIASCLSALDELIFVQMGKIEQLQLHKKGLMQVLFPTIDI